MKILGIIPARSGSKGIPGKNLASIGGKPLIVWTIEAARSSKRLARCVVSTDGPDIAAVCRDFGGEVPFMRPAELARDETLALPVVLHALEALAESYDAVMLLQPTSPLRTAGDIDHAIGLLESDSDADAVISVVAVGDRHPARMKYLRDGYLVDPPFAEITEGQRRQVLEPLYLRNGAIYLTRTEILLAQGTFKGKRCRAYVMPEDRSVNIDGPLDLVMAAALVARQKGEGPV